MHKHRWRVKLRASVAALITTGLLVAAVPVAAHPPSVSAAATVAPAVTAPAATAAQVAAATQVAAAAPTPAEDDQPPRRHEVEWESGGIEFKRNSDFYHREFDHLTREQQWKSNNPLGQEGIPLQAGQACFQPWQYTYTSHSWGVDSDWNREEEPWLEYKAWSLDSYSTTERLTFL